MTAKDNDEAARADRRAAKTDREAAVTDRGAAVTDRSAAADDRASAAVDRSVAAGDHQRAKSGAVELEELRQELAAANAIMVGLSKELSADRVETAVRVEGLRAEQQRERRVRMMAVVAGGYLTISLYDQHVEHCSPGSRVVKGVDALLKTPATPLDTPDARAKVFTDAYNHASSGCDVTLPFHTHDGSGWPTTADMVGMSIVAVAAVLTAFYHRYRTKKDFARVEQAGREEEQPRAH